PPPSAAEAPAALLSLPVDGTVSIRLTHAGGDAWAVDYAFPEPLRAVAFRHARIARDEWRIVDPPGATRSGRYVVSAQPFTRLRVELRTTNAQPDKEYRPFYRYADRGVLAYTGQLGVVRAVCSAAECVGDGGLPLGEDYAGTLTLVAAAGEQVVVQGHSAASEARVPLRHEGTYAYFGTLAPVETAGFVGVLDRGMPEWMRSRVSADLPSLFAFYARRLGPLDDPKPTVFLTYAAREHGVSLGGGVLEPHLVTLDLELDATRLADSSSTRLDIDRLVAHEAAHFWNDDQHRRRGDPGSAWLDEGGADALAVRVLRANGVLDDAAYRAALSEAASECALWLSGGEPLDALTRPAHSRALYVCGATMSLVAEAAVRRRDPGADLFTFWRAVFDEGGPAYDEATFLRVLDRLAGDPAAGRAVRRLVHERLDDPGRALRDALRLVGLETTTGAPEASPPEYEQHGSIPEMDALLPRACARALTFDGDVEVRPTVGADGACPGLSRGDRIERGAGVPVARQGGTSFQRAYAACRARHAVEVVTATGVAVTVPCDLQTKTAPSYFELVRAP
ncbi:MAG TPA: hypothetical protein VHS09_01600, partial [Polyangiaceae bacterium]|nr:hypothetical protein [Polyangiaceae bacterium]